jgi:1,4-dihydroxy-2-naphthoate octaprenyltransferase
METADKSRVKVWLMAIRPQTLPAAAAPVVVGTGLAVRNGVFAPLPAVAALVGAALIQIGTNLTNDYYDAVKGADTEEREGFTRVTQAGLIAPEQVRLGAGVAFVSGVLVGLYLTYVGGLPILAVGVLAVISGIAYTAGPYPLGYHGLGDVFVFVFFGVVAVTGTYYVQAAEALVASPVPTKLPSGTVPVEAVVASLTMAGISTNVLVVNNIRDMETDRAAGKRTLAVRLGYGGSRTQYVSLLVVAYAVPPVLWLGYGFEPSVLAPLLTVPYAAAVTRTVLTRTDGEALNPALEQTGKLLGGFAVLFGIGMAV